MRRGKYQDGVPYQAGQKILPAGDGSVTHILEAFGVSAGGETINFKRLTDAELRKMERGAAEGENAAEVAGAGEGSIEYINELLDILNANDMGLLRDVNGRNPMDPKKFQRIKELFERHGGIIDQSDEAQRYLQYRGASACTLNENTILMRQDPTLAEVFEELIHSAQFRTGKITDQSVYSTIQSEIAAAEKMIRYRKQYEIQNDETRQTIQRLRQLRDMLKDIGS